jgi:hypothetical protein
MTYYKDHGWLTADWAGFPGACIKHRAPYKVGDILWVRETWADTKDSPGNIHYKASATEADLEWLKDCGIKWKSPLFMPRVEARLFLKVTDVRAERLQDITEEDAEAEGLYNTHGFIRSPDNSYADYPHTAKEAFVRLWDTLNAKRGYGWDANSWVWVYEFEREEI